MNRILLTFGAVLGILCQTSNAEALIASVKATGMAATCVAYPQDALVGAYNPAGHAEIGNRVDAGLTWAHYRGRSIIRDNQAPSFIGKVNGSFNGYRTNEFFSPDFGINKTFGNDCQFAVGFIVFNRSHSKTTYATNFPLIGTSKMGLEYIHEQISPVFAWKIHDCFNIGISLNYHVQRLKVNGIENFDNPLRSRYPGKVTNRGYNYSSGVGCTIGAQWYILPELSVGASYQPKTHMRRFKKYEGFLANRGRFDIPERWLVGLAWRFADCATIAFDVENDRWSHIRALNNPLLSEGVIKPLGSKNGVGFGWKDQTFYRIGVDYALTENLVIRTGFRHANSPIKKSQTVVNQLTLDTVTDVATFGATYAFNECFELSSFFAWGIRHRINGHHSIPEHTFGGGNASVKQQFYAFGASFGWNY
ncbi:MAG: OmpP1/FadL family transporter [Parachlamydiaceae bacterium]